MFSRLRAAVFLAAALAAAAGAQEIDLDPGVASTSNPAVSARPGGGFAATWARDRHIPLSFGPDAFVPQSVIWQRLRVNGTAASSRRLAGDAGPTGSVMLPQVATDERGIEVVWGRPAGLGFLLAGRRVLPEQAAVTLAACDSGKLRGLRLLPAANGSWLIWSESCDGLRVVALRLDARGRPTSTARVLVGAHALVGKGLDFAVGPDGGLVGAWTQRVVDGQDDHRVLVAGAFRPDGRPRGALIRVGVPSDEIAVVADARGRIWVAWRDNRRLVAGAFRPDGTAFAPARPLGTFEGASERSPRWSNVEDGSFILVWERLREDGSQSCLARRFDGSGPRGGERVVAERCLSPSVALSGGRTLVAWQRPAENPELANASRALARLLPARAW